MSDSDEPPSKKSKKTLPCCPYGERCYRKNPKHLEEFAHLSKDSKGDRPQSTKTDTAKLPACPFGSGCYRKNLVHFAEYSHPLSGGGAGVGAGDSSSGSDTEEYDSDDGNNKKQDGPGQSKLGKVPSLNKRYSQMTEDERRMMIEKAVKAKKELEEELKEAKLKMEEKDRELNKLQDELSTGMLLVDGEKEVLEKGELTYFPLLAERAYREGSADQVHFRLAESQFYRLLGGSSGGQYRVTKVEYVVNPELVERFKQARDDMKLMRGEGLSYPVLAFHGTDVKNITPIVEKGFKVPGDKGFKHKTDTGFWGRGVYFSEFPSYSMGYIAGSTKLLLCQVLLGKVYQCTKLIHGQKLQKGYDTHISPSKMELIVFNAYHILPSYIVHYKTSTANFKYTLRPEEKRKPVTNEEMTKLYTKAMKQPDSNVFAGKNIKLHGKMVDIHGRLYALIKSHGGTAVTGTTGFFNLLVTNQTEFSKNTNVHITNANAWNAAVVPVTYIFDSIIQKTLQDTDYYVFDDN